MHNMSLELSGGAALNRQPKSELQANPSLGSGAAAQLIVVHVRD